MKHVVNFYKIDFFLKNIVVYLSIKMELSIITLSEEYQRGKLNTYTDKQKEKYENFIKKSENDLSRFNLENMSLEDISIYADEIYVEMHQVLLNKLNIFELYMKNMLKITEYNYSFMIKFAYSLSRLSHTHENYYIYLKRFRHIKNNLLYSNYNIIKVPSYRVIINKV